SQLPVISEIVGDENGVCRYLGYERYADKSAVYGTRGELNVCVNSYGSALRIDRHYSIISLICVNKRNDYPVGEQSVVVHESQLYHAQPGVSLAALNTDHADGACRYLGYDRYLGDACFSDRTDRTILLNADTTVHSGPFGKPLTRLICL